MRWINAIAAQGGNVIRILRDLPDNVLGIEAIGKVTDDDYENILAPAIQNMRSRDKEIRIVYVLGKEFDGWTTGAAWEDTKLGLSELRAWQKIAIVSDKDWVRHTVKAIGWMMPGDVRAFDLDDLAAAKQWAAK
jgi:stage II sporulation SpoAA-like protein